MKRISIFFWASFLLSLGVGILAGCGASADAITADVPVTETNDDTPTPTVNNDVTIAASDGHYVPALVRGTEARYELAEVISVRTVPLELSFQLDGFTADELEYAVEGPASVSFITSGAAAGVLVFSEFLTETAIYVTISTAADDAVVDNTVLTVDFKVRAEPLLRSIVLSYEDESYAGTIFSNTFVPLDFAADSFYYEVKVSASSAGGVFNVSGDVAANSGFFVELPTDTLVAAGERSKRLIVGASVLGGAVVSDYVIDVVFELPITVTDAATDDPLEVLSTLGDDNVYSVNAMRFNNDDAEVLALKVAMQPSFLLLNVARVLAYRVTSVHFSLEGGTFPYIQQQDNEHVWQSGDYELRLDSLTGILELPMAEPGELSVTMDIVMALGTDGDERDNVTNSLTVMSARSVSLENVSLLYNDGQLQFSELGTIAADYGRQADVLIGEGGETFNIHKNVYNLTAIHDTNAGGYIEVVYTTEAPDDRVVVEVSFDGGMSFLGTAALGETPSRSQHIMAEVGGFYRIYIGNVILDDDVNTPTDDGLAANELNSALLRLTVSRTQAGEVVETANYLLTIDFIAELFPEFAAVTVTYADSLRADQESDVTFSDFDEPVDLTPVDAGVDPFVLNKPYISSSSVPHAAFMNSGSGVLTLEPSLLVDDGSVVIDGVYTEDDFPASIRLSDVAVPSYNAALHGVFSIPFNELILDEAGRVKLYLRVVEEATIADINGAIVAGTIENIAAANAGFYELVIQFVNPVVPVFDEAFTLSYDAAGDFQLNPFLNVNIVDGFSAAFANGNIYIHDTEGNPDLPHLYNKIGGKLSLQATIPAEYELVSLQINGVDIADAELLNGEGVELAAGVEVILLSMVLYEIASIDNTAEYQFLLNFTAIEDISTDTVASFAAATTVEAATLSQELLPGDEPLFLATFSGDTVPTVSDTLTPSITGAAGYFVYLLDKVTVDVLLDGTDDFSQLMDLVINNNGDVNNISVALAGVNNITDFYIFVTTVEVAAAASQEDLAAADGVLFPYRVGFFNVITPALGELRLSYYGYKLIEAVPEDFAAGYVNPVAAFSYDTNVYNIAHIDYGAENAVATGYRDYYLPSSAFIAGKLVNADDGSLIDLSDFSAGYGGVVSDFFSVEVADIVELEGKTVVSFELRLFDADETDAIIFRTNLYTINVELAPRITLAEMQQDVAAVFARADYVGNIFVVTENGEHALNNVDFVISNDAANNSRTLTYINNSLAFEGYSVLALTTGELEGDGYTQYTASFSGSGYNAPGRFPAGSAFSEAYSLALASVATASNNEQLVVTFTENDAPSDYGSLEAGYQRKLAFVLSNDLFLEQKPQAEDLLAAISGSQVIAVDTASTLNVITDTVTVSNFINEVGTDGSFNITLDFNKGALGEGSYVLSNVATATATAGGAVIAVGGIINNRTTFTIANPEGHEQLLLEVGTFTVYQKDVEKQFDYAYKLFASFERAAVKDLSGLTAADVIYAGTPNTGAAALTLELADTDIVTELVINNVTNRYGSGTIAPAERRLALPELDRHTLQYETAAGSVISSLILDVPEVAGVQTIDHQFFVADVRHGFENNKVAYTVKVHYAEQHMIQPLTASAFIVDYVGSPGVQVSAAAADHTFTLSVTNRPDTDNSPRTLTFGLSADDLQYWDAINNVEYNALIPLVLTDPVGTTGVAAAQQFALRLQESNYPVNGITHYLTVNFVEQRTPTIVLPSTSTSLAYRGSTPTLMLNGNILVIDDLTNRAELADDERLLSLPPAPAGAVYGGASSETVLWGEDILTAPKLLIVDPNDVGYVHGTANSPAFSYAFEVQEAVYPANASSYRVDIIDFAMQTTLPTLVEDDFTVTLVGSSTPMVALSDSNEFLISGLTNRASGTAADVELTKSIAGAFTIASSAFTINTTSFTIDEPVDPEAVMLTVATIIINEMQYVENSQTYIVKASFVTPYDTGGLELDMLTVATSGFTETVVADNIDSSGVVSGLINRDGGTYTIVLPAVPDSVEYMADNNVTLETNDDGTVTMILADPTGTGSVNGMSYQFSLQETLYPAEFFEYTLTADFAEQALLPILEVSDLSATFVSDGAVLTIELLANNVINIRGLTNWDVGKGTVTVTVTKTLADDFVLSGTSFTFSDPPGVARAISNVGMITISEAQYPANLVTYEILAIFDEGDSLFILGVEHLSVSFSGSSNPTVSLTEDTFKIQNLTNRRNVTGSVDVTNPDATGYVVSDTLIINDIPGTGAENNVYVGTIIVSEVGYPENLITYHVIADFLAQAVLPTTALTLDVSTTLTAIVSPVTLSNTTFLATVYSPTVGDYINCAINFDVSGFEVEENWVEAGFGAIYEITAEHVSAGILIVPAENFFAIKETAYPANKLDYSLSITFE